MVGELFYILDQAANGPYKIVEDHICDQNGEIATDFNDARDIYELRLFCGYINMYGPKLADSPRFWRAFANDHESLWITYRILDKADHPNSAEKIPFPLPKF